MLAFLATALAVAALTWVVGWWGVVLVALLAGVLLCRRPGAGWLVAFAAVAAWAALIALDAIGGRMATLAASIAGVMRVPMPALLLVTLLFGGLLAWSAAVVGSEIGRLSRAGARSGVSRE